MTGCLGVCDHVTLLFPEQRSAGSYPDEMGSVEAYQENSSTLVYRMSQKSCQILCYTMVYYLFVYIYQKEALESPLDRRSSRNLDSVFSHIRFLKRILINIKIYSIGRVD